MTEDSPLGTPMDWGTARVHIQTYINRVVTPFVALQYILATADQAKSYLTGAQLEIDKLDQAIERSKQALTEAEVARKTAEAGQRQAEKATKEAEADSRVRLDSLRVDLANALQFHRDRLADLERDYRERQEAADAAHRGRMAQLAEEIAAQQAHLDDLNSSLDAIAARLGRIPTG